MAKRIEATYGDALFELAVEESRVDSLYDEAGAENGRIDDNPEFGRLLNHPEVEKGEKEGLINNIFSQFVSGDMTGLLITMVSKDRQKKIVDTLEYFRKRVLEYKKIGIAYVSTAKPLTDEQKKAVAGKLLETTGYVDFQMHYSVDESLIGGMVIRIGDRVVDSSIKHKIDELSRSLMKIQL